MPRGGVLGYSVMRQAAGLAIGRRAYKTHLAVISAPPSRLPAGTLIRQQSRMGRGLKRSGDMLEVHYRNDRYLAEAEGIGRAARAIAGELPAGVERMVLVPRQGELAPSAVTLERADLVALQDDLDGSWKSFARAEIDDGRAHPLSLRTPGAYPRFIYGVDLYAGPTLSDPDNFVAESGLRFDALLALAHSTFGTAGFCGQRCPQSLVPLKYESSLSQNGATMSNIAAIALALRSKPCLLVSYCR